MGRFTIPAEFQPKLIIRLATSFLLFSIFLADVSTGNTAPQEMRVLFIGNSLTYWNDLPAIVQAMGKAGKRSKLKVATVAYPDHSLEDHWNRGEALRAIKENKWDWIVLQQGPSASVEGRASLLRYASMFVDQIRAVGSQPVLFSVWPNRIRAGDMERSIESYTLAAKQTNALLIPAGRAWQIAWQLDPKLNLYDADGLHPGKEGSYLAALVFYKTFFSQDSSRLPSRLKLSSKNASQIEIEDSHAKTLQQAAELSVQPAGAINRVPTKPYKII